jgi:hypothetical protein
MILRHIRSILLFVSMITVFFGGSFSTNIFAADTVLVKDGTVYFGLTCTENGFICYGQEKLGTGWVASAGCISLILPEGAQNANRKCGGEIIKYTNEPSQTQLINDFPPDKNPSATFTNPVNVPVIKDPSKITNNATPDKSIDNSNSSNIVSTEKAVDKTPTKNTDIFSILLNLIFSIVLLLIWILGSLASAILWIVMSIFIILVRINPADANWINVAIAPWGVIQSISNLLILGAFVYVGLGYLLNIQKLKMKIDQFLTNIVIVAIVTNMTLLGTASVINIAQGVGDAFVGAYSLVRNGRADKETIQDAFIKNTLGAFQVVSQIRCGNLTTGGGAKATFNPFVVQVNAAEAKSVSQGAKEAQCSKASGDVAKFENIGDIFANAFKQSFGDYMISIIREFVYLLLIIVAIFAFFRVLMIALIRALALWFLMVTSPFALAAYYSPDGFGLKKWGTKWLNNFFYYCIFYPAFVLALILAQELTGAFNSATKKIADQELGQTIGLDIPTLVSGVLVGVVAAGVIWMLADFFEKIFKSISDGMFEAVGTVGGFALNKLAAPAGGFVQALNRGGVKTFSKEVSSLQAQLAATKDPAARQQIQARLERSQKNLIKAQTAGDRVAGNVRRLGNFVEMLPERRNELENFGKTIGERWKNDKKARLASFREGDRLRGELFWRQNPEIAKRLGIDPDLDPKALLRGETKEEMDENIAKDPNYYKSLVSKTIKKTYDKNIGSDTAIRRDIAQRRLLKLAAKVGGDFDKLKPDMRDFFIDALEQHSGDDALMSALATDSNATNMVRQVMGSNRLEPKVEQSLRKDSPIFIADAGDRRRQVGGLSPKEQRNIASYNLSDEHVVDGLRDGGMNAGDIAEISNNKGFTPLSENHARKTALDTASLPEEAKTRIGTFREKALQKGYTQSTPAFTGITKELMNNPAASESVLKQQMTSLESMHFGDSASLEAIKNNNALTGVQKLDQIQNDSIEARAYVNANAAVLGGLSPEEQVHEVLTAVSVGRDSYKQNEEILFKQLKDNATEAAKALTKADVASAGADQTVTTFKKLRGQDKAIEGMMAAGGREIHQELGIEAGFDKIIKDAKKSGNVGAYDISTAVNGQKADTLKEHLQNISVAINAKDQKQFDKAKAAAKKEFQNDKNVQALIDKEFISHNQSSLGMFDTTIQAEGSKVRNDLDIEITDLKKGRGDDYAVAAREIIAKKIEKAKDRSTTSASKAIESQGKISGGDVKGLVDQIKGERKTNI